MVLQRLFDIILTLAKSSLALRGHREDLSQEGYHGNFLSFVELVARYDQILRQVLDMHREIVLKSPNKDERNEAESIKTKMLNFEFVLLCELMHSVLNDINYASKTLQKCDIYLGEASKALAETKGKLQIYRNNFELFKCKASEAARKYDIDTHFQEKRQRKVKKHFDELAADHRFPNREEIFKVQIFNNIVDILIAQLNTRFKVEQLDRRQAINTLMKRAILQDLQQMLHEHHTLIRLFKTTLERMPNGDYKIVVRADKRLVGTHERRFNAIIDEVAIVIVGENLETRDIVYTSRYWTTAKKYMKHTVHMIRCNIR
ncbi:hypothetical protein EVAR_10226_1 [Eumeta japonica]|uniref:Uncharacterized protein n=1 Tax=Eumeta variegata TaxID=151549 RepID=A0A4C1TGK9_EUMVA|nr:hypothetical protein EVAR_10226_1 [Eumeta japonica]